ncbi:MAG: DUF2829 domain-containing protein [Enterocloster bolteae]
MKFLEALNNMKKGIPMKLPSWGGFWCWDTNEETIIMYTKDNQRLDIRETQRVEYTLRNVMSDEWEVANGENTPILGGNDLWFPAMLLNTSKRGLKKLKDRMERGNQHIELAVDISYKNADGEIVTACMMPLETKRKAIAFCWHERGVQMGCGWQARAGAVLAEDWVCLLSNILAILKNNKKGKPHE